MKKSLLFAAALLSLAACTREKVVNVPEGDMVLVAKTERPGGTRTALEGGTFVFWEPGDEIAVYAGGKSGKFASDLTANVASATFRGTLGEDTWSEGMDLWAVYPYSDKAVFDGETVTTVLPSEQTARAGSFGKGMNLSVARSTTATLQFYNVGGGVRFSLSQDGITEVVFEGLNGEILAGKVKIGFQDGVPAILEVTEGKTSITLTPPEGETFKKDAWYYIVAIPGALENGFTFRFRKADNSEMPSGTYSKAVTVKRGSYGVLTYVDKGMDQTVPDDIISFKDPLVKSIVVKYFDTSGDGELSYHEAAVVLSFLVDVERTRATDELVSIFAGTDITTFDELVYFTGLTRIDDGAFAGCTELRSITIPENIESIGDNAFQGCTSLESITATSPVPPAIGTDAFANTGECPILVPEGSVDAYVAAWGEYEERIRAKAYPEPEIVDLGLPSGVKWASFNLGASSSEETGDYFAWGETEPYYSSLDPLTWKEGKEAGYDWPSYRWCMGTVKTITKYCYSSSYGYEGFVDNKYILDPEDDAATVHLGGKWRMPTAAEFKEMLMKCDHERTTQEGVDGWKITGPNGNSIFLPSATSAWVQQEMEDPVDNGFYWSSSLFTNMYGFGIILYPSSDEWNFYGHFRSTGMPVRPVYGDPGIPIESITMDKTTLKLQVGESATLTATILPENATIKDVTWMSGDETVATVSPTGVVTAVGPGTTWVSAMTFDPEHQASCEVSVHTAPEIVDLGLPSGVKWASFNLGASSPEGAGDYFAWGETEPYYSSLDPLTWKEGKETGYELPSYKWYRTDTRQYTKYSDFGEGKDNKYVLDFEDDAAAVSLGDKWRMPTAAEFQEMLNKCDVERTSLNGTAGWKVTGPNGNSIFLPATTGSLMGLEWESVGDRGYFWTINRSSSNAHAYSLCFDLPKGEWYILNNFRSTGMPVRPVYGDPTIAIERVVLNMNNLELGIGESATLTATILPENATIRDYTWESGDTDIVTVSSTGVVTAVGPGDTWVIVRTLDPGRIGYCNVSVRYPVPEAVDLGLSVKWSSFNLGASSPEEAGDYFAWGETTAKGLYSWSNYAWGGGSGSGSTLTKYTGAAGDKTTLDPEDDAAFVKLGGKWRMPTYDEWAALTNTSDFDWTWDDTRKGYTVTSKIAGYVGNSIFLPAAGYRRNTRLYNSGDCGLYWSSSLFESDPRNARGMYLEPSYMFSYYDARYSGFSVRPVFGDRSVSAEGDIEGTGEEPWN